MIAGTVPTDGLPHLVAQTSQLSLGGDGGTSPRTFDAHEAKTFTSCEPAGSDLSISSKSAANSGALTAATIGSAVSATGCQHIGFERRVAWLEEDVAVLRRRLLDECGEGATGGDNGLRALVARLDGEVMAERRLREALVTRMCALEELIQHERKEREAQLRGFSNDLESTIRELIGRIDEGLSAGALFMRERTDATETRLRNLIKRVDEGLSAGAAALQDTLAATDAVGDASNTGIPALGSQLNRHASPLRSVKPELRGTVAAAPEVTGTMSRPQVSMLQDNHASEVVPTDRGQLDRVVQSWDQLREDNVRTLQECHRRLSSHSLRQPEVLPHAISGASCVSAGISPTATPLNVTPSTMQVLGSGLVPGPTAGCGGHAPQRSQSLNLTRRAGMVPSSR